MLDKVKKKIRKAASIIGGIVETSVEGLKDITDEIYAPDFD